MTMEERSPYFQFRLRPPDRGAMWGDLALTPAQAAATTGVPERQIQHWLRRGYLPSSPGHDRRLNGDALDFIVLVRQARVAGIPLARAVNMAKQHLAEAQSHALRTLPTSAEEYRELEAKLDDAIDAIRSVKATVHGARELLIHAGARRHHQP